LNGESYFPRNSRHAISRGVYLAPEDRKRHGLVLPMTIAQNTSLPDVCNYSSIGWLNRGTERKVAAKEVSRMRIKAPSVEVKTVNLSGGNQQKVVLGKWLAMKPTVLILDEPTRGIDVGAKAEIYALMRELADNGAAILMITSEMPELLRMSDRILVMREGALVGEMPRADASEERVVAYTSGGEKAWLN
jgi:ribose transport system ATP-binding protein